MVGVSVTALADATDDCWQFDDCLLKIDGCIEVIEQEQFNEHLDRAEAYFQLGYAYDQLSEYGRAVQSFDQTISLDPNHAFAFNSRGLAYEQLGQLERALQDFDRSIALDPSNPAAFLNRGGVYHHLGQYDLAVQDYDEAIAISGWIPELMPQFQGIWAHAKYALAFSLYLNGRAEEGLVEIEGALTVDGSNLDYLYARGCILCAMGRRGDALYDLRRVVELGGAEWVVSFQEYFGRLGYGRGVVDGRWSNEDLGSLYDWVNDRCPPDVASTQRT